MSDMTAEQQQHPPSFAGLLGDLDHDVPTFLDAPATPGPRSTAVRFNNRGKADAAEARRDRDLEVVDRAARDEADDLALAKATRLRRDGQPVPASILARAARAARARGTSMSSAEIMARRAGRS